MRFVVVGATALYKIQLGNQFKNSLFSSVQYEVPYAEILEELLGGTREAKKNNLIFKQMNNLLFVHD